MSVDRPDERVIDLLEHAGKLLGPARVAQRSQQPRCQTRKPADVSEQHRAFAGAREGHAARQGAAAIPGEVVAGTLGQGPPMVRPSHGGASTRCH